MSNRIRWTLLIGILALLSTTGFSQQPAPPAPAAASPQGGAPRIKLDRLIQDFKDVKPALELITEFTISNTGDALLEIKDVRTTCGCTVPALEKRMLAPGESTKMTVKLRPPNASGLVDKKVTLTCNDPNLPQVQVSLVANVVLDVVVEPQFVRFDGVARTEAAQTDVWLTPKVMDTFKILEVKSESPYVTIEQQMESGKIHLKVKLDAPSIPANPGTDYMNTLIHIKTTSESHPDILIPVNIRFLPEFSAIPQRLQVFMKASDKSVSRDILIRHANDQPFKITAARSSNTFVKPSVTKNDQGTNVVTATIESQPGVPLIQGIITLEIDSKSLSVPFRVTVEPVAAPVAPAVPQAQPASSPTAK